MIPISHEYLCLEVMPIIIYNWIFKYVKVRLTFQILFCNTPTFTKPSYISLIISVRM